MLSVLRSAAARIPVGTVSENTGSPLIPVLITLNVYAASPVLIYRNQL
jgi:hypothetical protein